MNEEQREKLEKIVESIVSKEHTRGFAFYDKNLVYSMILHFMIGAMPLEFNVSEEEIGRFVLWCAEKTL